MDNGRMMGARIITASVVTATLIGGVLTFAGCSLTKKGDGISTPVSASSEPVRTSYVADFYDNYGSPWFSITGRKFSISPNKVKEYAYSSNGAWVSSYTTSSVVSVEIDGQQIESCGSTIIFADTRLKQYPIDIPTEVKTTSGFTDASISDPNDLRFKDYWTLNWWWMVKDAYDYTGGAKIVIVQSQQGDPICMYSGNDVTWEVARNLPKTTEITIDDMKLYIHRANFTILNSTVFN